MSHVDKRMLLMSPGMLLLVLMTTGCASLSNAWASSPTATQFSGISGQIVFRQAEGIVQLPGRMVRTQDCANEEYFCIYSSSMVVVMPKDCTRYNQHSWNTGSHRSQVISSDFHNNRILVTSPESPDFAFLVAPSEGILEIYYDTERRGLFGGTGEWGNLGYERLRRLIFRKDSGPPLMACA
jgi:hypothetical protein